MPEEMEDNRTFTVVINHEEQYSIWHAGRAIPNGWKEVGVTGSKQHCLAHIERVWTDMRPLSLRIKMAEMESRTNVRQDGVLGTTPTNVPDSVGTKIDLVERLCTGVHPVEVSLRPDKTIAALQECLNRGYVMVKFTNTRGGTELGIRLDTSRTQTSSADLAAGLGTVHLVGGLTLDYVPVTCIADIDLASLTGTGHLERAEGA